ncbi:MAG: hypothetical protein VB877_03150 [Pirellulaceae bacterium]
MRPRDPLATGLQKTAASLVNPAPVKPPRSRISATLLSLILHGSCLVLALALFRFEPRGFVPQNEHPGGIVLVDSTGKTTRYFDVLDSRESRTSSIDTQPAAVDLPRVGSPSATRDLALPGSLPVASTSRTGLGGALDLPITDGSISLPNRPGTAEAAVQTGVFGLQGKGTRFVYVFDRSGSMAGFQGKPLANAKAQLLASLADLGSAHQFQIVFYADRPAVFNPRSLSTARMLFADAATKKIAERWVRGVVADGSTRHLDALLLAIRMQPDVIFFLTDAEEPRMTPLELEKIKRANQRVGASIHAIEFGAGPSQVSNNFLQRLARSNGGQHTYVDVTRLTP